MSQVEINPEWFGGNQDALNWAFDAKFARHLTIVSMNDSGMFKE